MTRQEKLRRVALAFIALAFICIGIQSCAQNSTTKLPSDDELKAAIRLDQQKWEQALQNYSDCLGAYVEKMFRSTASAGDIADGAASSCRSFAEQYAHYQMDERGQNMILYRKGYALGEMEQEMRKGPPANQIELDVAASNRGASIDYVLKLRAKFGG